MKTQERIKEKETAKKLWNLSAHLCGFEPEIPYEEPSPVPESPESQASSTEEKKEQ